MKELESHLKEIENKIKQSKTKIKKEITILQNLIKQQSLNYNMFKEQYKGKTYHMASVILDIPALEAKNNHKRYNDLTKKNVINKHFAEEMELIQTPLSKQPKKKVYCKSNIMKVGSVTSKIRKLNETNNLTDNEREVMRQLLNQMADEL